MQGFHLASSEICYQSICEYELIISAQLSHIYKPPDFMQPGYFDVDLDGTDLRIINNTLRNNEQYGPYIGQMVSEPDKVVTLDGVKRLILTVNGQFPAPPLEVKEGAQVSKAPATLSNASNMSDLRYVRSSDLMSNILESFSNGSLICISHSS